MASSISICSNALLALGAHPINSFGENSEHARLCSNIYPTELSPVKILRIYCIKTQ